MGQIIGTSGERERHGVETLVMRKLLEDFEFLDSLFRISKWKIKFPLPCLLRAEDGGMFGAD